MECGAPITLHICNKNIEKYLWKFTTIDVHLNISIFMSNLLQKKLFNVTILALNSIYKSVSLGKI